MTERVANQLHSTDRPRQSGMKLSDILALPTSAQRLARWMLRRQSVSLAEAVDYLNQPADEVKALFSVLTEKGFVQQQGTDANLQYQLVLASRSGRRMPQDVWQTLENRSATANVFISYSRRNKSFVQDLYERLRRTGREVWVDWEDIPFGTDWWKEIQIGIEGADTFIFVLSPASVASQVCGQEIEHALLNHKRLLPVVYEDVDPQGVHPELAKLNWIFMREGDDLNTAFKSLVQFLDTDLTYVRDHTRLLLKANEWEQKQRDESFLLRGKDLEAAALWLANSQDKNPQPGLLHRDYILASRKAESDRQTSEIQRQRVAIQRQRVGLALITLVSVVAIALGLTTHELYQKAQKESQIADKLRQRAEKENLSTLGKTSEALFQSNQRFEALLAAIRAGTAIQTIEEGEGGAATDALKTNIITVLQQAVFWVQEWNQFAGHNGIIWNVRFSPDGAMVASVSSDGTLKLWQLDGTLLATLEGHEGQVLGLNFSPDRQTLATSGHDATVKLWHRDGTLLRSMTGHQGPVHSVSFSPDGQTLASASEDGTIRLWTVDGTLIKVLEGHGAAVREVLFSPDGQTLVSASDDATLNRWNWRNGSVLNTFRGHAGQVSSVDFSPNGEILVSAGWDNTVRLWQKDGTPIRTIAAHDDLIYDVRFSPDGTVLASASWDNTIKLWNLEGDSITTLVGHSAQVRSLSFSPDGKRLVSGGGDRVVRLWQWQQKLVKTLRGHQAHVYDVAFSPNSQLIASAGADKTVKLWKRNGAELKTLEGHTELVWAVQFSPDSRLIASASSDRTLKLWNRQGKLLTTLRGHRGPVYDVAFSPDGQLLASASTDATIKLWTQEGKLIRTFTQAHDDGVLSVNFSPDGQKLVSTSWDGTAKLWELDGTLVQTFTGHSGWVYDASFGPDGLLATASYDNTVKLWTLDGTPIDTINGHRDGVVKVSFNSTGRMLATASYDNTVKFWQLDSSLRHMPASRLPTCSREAASGTADSQKTGCASLITTLQGHWGEVSGLSFSQDGLHLATASLDQTLLLWNLEALGDLDDLVERGCQWVENYLRTNEAVSDNDRLLCQASQSETVR